MINDKETPDLKGPAFFVMVTRKMYHACMITFDDR